jgi:hypothetical protein
MRKSIMARARKSSVTSRSVNTCVETLEIRRLLATITVTSTGNTVTPNDGAVTLVEAITAINAGNDLSDPNITAQNPTATNPFGTKDTIDFNIAGSGVQVILIGDTDWLPPITQPVTIDGYSQSGASPATAATPATIKIQVDGDGTVGGSNGLLVEAANVTIKGLSITHFRGEGGIVLDGFSANNDVVSGNYIGVDPSATISEGNNGSGIVMESGARFDTIGGSNAADRNIISGNLGVGVETKIGSGGVNSGEQDNLIEGNYIGTDPSGTKAIGIQTDGVLLDGGQLVTIGGTSTGARNLISGNVANGIHISGNNNSTVQGNYIGIDVTGSTALGNGKSGVLIDDGAQNNTIGGTSTGAGNLISGNGISGVQIDGTATGTNTIGNMVQGNFIGVDATGEIALGNPYSVLIDKGAQNNIIGGTTAGARNVISGGNPGEVGVWIEGTATGPQTSFNTVEGNYVGTDKTGAATVTFPNADFQGTRPPYGGDGIYISDNASNNTVGGTTADARNIISANLNFGVEIGESASQNTVEGNYIGTDVTGTKALGNGNGGVDISGATNNLIGGTSAGARNVISGNDHTFVDIGTEFVANGVLIEGFPSATGNVVAGNYIGTDFTGTAALGNSGSGVRLFGETSGNKIGGTTSASGNLIAYNALAGVEVSPLAGSGFTPTDNAIQRNSIYNNGGLGIDLDSIGEDDGVSPDSGITPNDVGDADVGPNEYQNFPVISAASYNASTVTVNGAFNSLPNTIFTLDFYANDTIDPSGNGEGKQWIGALAVLTDGNGNAVYSGTFNATIGNNKYISSTATNVSVSPFAETSEFSQTIEATGTTPGNPTPPTPPTISIGDVSMNEGNSGTTAFAFTVTRSGDLSGASSVQFATADGTAKVSDNDYQSQSNTIAFDPNQGSKTITILVNGDTKVESDETFVVNLSNATGATIADAQATGTILNDDAAPPPPPPPAGNKVSIITDPCDSTKKAIEIDGTTGNDTITVTKSGSSQGKVVVKINNVNKGTFSFTGSIIVHGGSGNDNISIDSAITRQTFIFGEAGNDTVSGGGGSDVIVGGVGNDKLSGNSGRDILIGSDGSDSLNGGNDDDIVDGGTTMYDTDISSLCKLQDEWTRTDKSYATRVQHITQGGGLNGSVNLNASTSFSSTSLKDTLTGGGGSDLFFAAKTGDKVTDKSGSETEVTIG